MDAAEESNAMPVNVAREIAHQGELRLDALLKLATAADQRATTMCGIFGATCVAVFAGVLALFAASDPDIRLMVGGTVTAVCLFAAAVIAAMAGAPRDFYIGGGSPDLLRNWSWADGGWRDEVAMLDASAQRHAIAIAEDKKLLESGSKRVISSLVLGTAAAPAGIAAYFIAGACCVP